MECEVTLMPKDQCAHCKGVTLETDWSKVALANSFTARFDSKGACGHSISEGDVVAFTMDDEVVCTRCATR